jgi:hypothetical protein
MSTITTEEVPTGLATLTPRTGARASTATGLMFLARILPTILGVLFAVADTALMIWLIATGHWGWLILSFILAMPIVQVGGLIVGLLVMPLVYGARLIDRETAELILNRWE